MRPEAAFVVRLDALDALCRGYVRPEMPAGQRDAPRDEAIAACKAARI